LGFKGKGGALSGILGIRRNQAYSGVIFDGSCDFYAEFIANRGAVRRLPGEPAYPNVDNTSALFTYVIARRKAPKQSQRRYYIMDELMLEMVKKFTGQLEQFLKACKDEGDTTIDDVLKRLEDLKKET